MAADPILDDLSALLSAHLTAEGITAEICLGRWLSDSADEAILLRTYPASEPRLVGPNGLAVDEPIAVQVIARGARYDVPKATELAEAAVKALSFRHQTLASGRRYPWCFANQVPAEAGVDANDRPHVSVNFRIRRHRTDV